MVCSQYTQKAKNNNKKREYLVDVPSRQPLSLRKRRPSAKHSHVEGQRLVFFHMAFIYFIFFNTLLRSPACYLPAVQFWCNPISRLHVPFSVPSRLCMGLSPACWQAGRRVCWTTASQLAGPVRREVYEGVRENEKIERRGGNIRGGDRAGEQGMGSLEFVVYRISGFLSTPFGSLTSSPASCFFQTAIFGSVTAAKTSSREQEAHVFSQLSRTSSRPFYFTAKFANKTKQNHPIFEDDT